MKSTVEQGVGNVRADEPRATRHESAFSHA